ncbi:MAG: RNA methyltransferase [Candidatus Hydrogenedentota bacterium]
MPVSELEPYYERGVPAPLPPKERQPVHVVLDNLRSAFNVGSIFRTADAGVAAHLHLCGTTAYPPNLKLQKTALGSTAYVPWTHYAATADAIGALRDQGIPIVAVETVTDAFRHTEFDWPRPVAIVFGNEVTGILPETIAQCDAVVRIPMLGYKNTINVATAFGIVFYEVLRRYAAV